MVLPIIYHYNPSTGRLLNQGFADQSPVDEDDWLIPAYATAIEPPVIPDGQMAVFDGTVWALKADSSTINAQILNAPDDLFGGPTIEKVLSGA